MKERRHGRIDEELVCVESFANFLSEDYGCEDIQIKREKNDPPDFWMSLSGKTFAIEVTSIAAGREYSGLCEGLRDSIAKECGARNCLKGKYKLRIFLSPEIPKRNSKSWQKAVGTAVTYISSTMKIPSAEEIRILDDDEGYVALEKLSDFGDLLTFVGPPQVKWDEKTTDLIQLIQQAINKKRKAIENKRVLSICPDVILLLYDAYGHCQMDQAVEAFQNISGGDFFHSVYWAASFSNRPNELYPQQPGRRGCLLYSNNAAWLPGEVSSV